MCPEQTVRDVSGHNTCAGCGAGELSASALSKQADSLRSLAAEGALLAEDASAGKTTRTFSRVHSSDLDKAA